MSTIQHLLARKCTGTKQQCETPSSMNTLAICLAVIIPVVLVALVVGFFAWKAYRRNKKEFLEEDDNPDFNSDNIILPDFPNENYHPSQMDLVNHNKNRNISNVSLQGPPNRPQPSKRASYSNSLDAFSIPFADSMNDLNKFSKSLGYDYEDFNYPIKKINASSKSMPGSRIMSTRSSFSENSKPLTGYANSFNSSDNPVKSSPLKSSTRKSSSTVSEGDEDVENDQSIIYHHDVSHQEEVRNSYKPQSIIPSIINEDIFADAYEQPIEEEEEEEAFVVNNNIHSKQEENEVVPNGHVYDQSIELHDSDNLPLNRNSFAQKTVTESDVPLSVEEEERLNRMKSVYQVYFSRENSIKKPNETNHVDSDNLPSLPKNVEVEYKDEMSDQVNEMVPSKNRNQLQIPGDDGVAGDDENTDNHRESVSSSIYISNAGQHPHQQFQNQQQQEYPDPGDMGYEQYGYPVQEQQYYQQQQQGGQYGYPQQHHQQQYYQQNDYYGGYPPQQQEIRSHHPLPDGKQSVPIPLPHQLAKRTSTLETFTTFKNSSHSKNPLKQMTRPDDRFHPIEHAAWQEVNRPQGPLRSSSNEWKGELGSQPSPSQLRHSVVMMNPMSISGKKVHQYKGTAKEQVRINNQHQIPQQEPLYGFIDGYERPHGAENLIPRSNSQIDLRRELDNANV